MFSNAKERSRVEVASNGGRSHEGQAIWRYSLFNIMNPAKSQLATYEFP
jgi:hypothetical protein